jgi:hypothetical protein
MTESKFYKEFDSLMFQKNAVNVDETYFYRKVTQDIQDYDSAGFSTSESNVTYLKDMSKYFYRHLTNFRLSKVLLSAHELCTN